MLINICDFFLECLKKIIYCFIPERNESTLRFVYTDNNEKTNINDTDISIYSEYRTEENSNYFNSCSSI